MAIVLNETRMEPDTGELFLRAREVLPILQVLATRHGD